jgi:hypothetical protein
VKVSQYILACFLLIPNLYNFKEPSTGILQQSMRARNRVDNPFPTRFLVPIDCFKIPAQERFQGIDSARARICKRLKSPEFDSKESIPPACVACRTGTSNRVVVPAHQNNKKPAGNRCLGPLKGYKFPALAT